jgi:hypothetical protein
VLSAIACVTERPEYGEPIVNSVRVKVFQLSEAEKGWLPRISELHAQLGCEPRQRFVYRVAVHTQRPARRERAPGLGDPAVAAPAKVTKQGNAKRRRRRRHGRGRRMLGGTLEVRRELGPVGLVVA